MNMFFERVFKIHFIKLIMRSLVKDFEYIVKSNKLIIKDYQLIALFGSVLDKNKTDDVDLVTIGNTKKHKLFINLIKKYFQNKGFEVIVFKTIKKKPEIKGKNIILIHNLHYPNIESLLDKEWLFIIRKIKLSSLVLYGSKKNIPLIKVKEKDIWYPYYKWVKKIKTKEDFRNFKIQLIKGLNYNYIDYPKLILKPKGNKILHLLNKSGNWHEKKVKIIKLFSENL